MDKSEVVVRIVSNAYDADKVERDLLRISKNGAVELENESGQFSFTEDMVRDLAKDWSRFQGRQRKNTRYTTNIVLSMPAGTEPQALKRASQAFAKRQFGQNYQYAMPCTRTPTIRMSNLQCGILAMMGAVACGEGRPAEVAGGLRARAGAPRGGGRGDATRHSWRDQEGCQRSSAPHSRERPDARGGPGEGPGGSRGLPRPASRSSTEATPLGGPYQGAPDLCSQGLADGGPGHGPEPRPRGPGAG